MFKKLFSYLLVASMAVQSGAIVRAETEKVSTTPTVDVSGTAAEEAPKEEVPYEVTVNSQLEQEIKGWGVTPTVTSNAYTYAATDVPANVYRDLGITIARFNFWTETHSDDGINLDTNTLDRLCESISSALDNGIDKYMLTAWAIPVQLQDGRTLDYDKRVELGEYFVRCLDYITKVKGLPKPVAFSPQNEPGNGGNPWGTCNYNSLQYAPMFKAVSRVLDENGYGDILMIGPENASAYGMFGQFGFGEDGALSDPEFFDSLDAYCIHGYKNYDESEGSFTHQDIVSRTKMMMETIAQYPYKDMWQTEYSTIDTSQTVDKDDLTIMSTRSFIADMNAFRCNYWFWWVAYATNSIQWDEFSHDYETLYFGDSSNTTKLARRGQFFKKIFHSVPVGSHVQKIETTDPLATTSGYENLQDATAFDTENGTVIVYINRDTEEHEYNFNNLDGKSAKVYTLTYSVPGKEDMYVSWETSVKNGRMENIPLPARSTNIIVCSRDNKVEPRVSLSNDAYGVTENGNTYIGKTEFNIFGKLNTPSSLTINGEAVKVNDDLTFSHPVTVKGEKPRYKIEGVSKDGTKMTPEIVEFVYNPYYLISTIDVPANVNSKTAKITGTTNVPATVVINGTEVQTDEHNAFAYDLPVTTGTNKVNTYFKLGNGRTQDERSFEVVADYTPPEFEIVTGNGVSTINSQYIVRMKANSDDIDTMWIGDHEDEITNEHIKARKDGIVEKTVNLKPGDNEITFYAKDYAGNISSPQTVHITYNETDESPKRTLRQTYAHKRTQPITLDAKFDEPEWQLDNLATLNYETTDASLAKFGTMWDDEALYIAVEVEDNELCFGRARPYEHDCVEIFLNPSGDRGGVYWSEDRQLFFSKYGYNSDGNPLYQNNDYPGIEYQFDTFDGGYRAEIKIPWSAMANKKAEAGASIGFDITIDDTDVWDEYRTSTLCWAGDSAVNYYNTEVFGLLTLVESKADVKYVTE